MTALSPLNDKLDIYSASLGQLAEVTPYVLAQKILKAGVNVTLTPDGSDGTVVINASGGGGGGGGITTVNHNASLAGDGNSVPLAVVQATETQLGGAQVVSQAEANAGTNDTDMLTIAKLLNLSGNALIALKALIGVGGSGVLMDASVTGAGDLNATPAGTSVYRGSATLRKSGARLYVEFTFSTAAGSTNYFVTTTGVVSNITTTGFQVDCTNASTPNGISWTYDPISVRVYG